MTAATMSEDDDRRKREQTLLDTLARLAEASRKMGEQIKESTTVAGSVIDRSFFKRWQTDRNADDKIADQAYTQRAQTNVTLANQTETLHRQERISKSIVNELSKLRQCLLQRMDDELEYRKLMDRRNGIRKQVSSWERLANERQNQPTTGKSDSGSSSFDLPFNPFEKPGGKPGTAGGWFGKGKKPNYKPVKPGTRPPMTRRVVRPEVNGGFIGKSKQLVKKAAETRMGRAVTRLGERVAGSAAGQGLKTVVQGGVKKVAESAAGQTLKKGAAIAAEKLAGVGIKSAATGALRTGAELLGKVPVAGLLVTGGLTAYDQSQKTDAEIAAEGGKTTSTLKSLAGNATFGLSDFLMDQMEKSKTVQDVRNSEGGKVAGDMIGRIVALTVAPFSKEARDALKADWKANVTPIVDKSLKAIDDTTKSWRDGMTDYTKLAMDQLGVWKDIAGNGLQKMISVITKRPTILGGMAFNGIKKAAENLLPSNWDVSSYIPKGVKDFARSKTIKEGYLKNRDALIYGAKRSGADVGFLTRIAAAESGFDEKIDAGQNGKYKTTAGGLYQFTDGTWNDMLRRYGKQLGLAPTASKYDPKAASLLAGKLAGDNKRKLDANLGRPANAYDQYMAWFLGAGQKAGKAKGKPQDIGKRVGAIGFLDAMAKDPNAIAADVMESSVVNSNESVFYEMGKDASGKKVRKRARTLAEVYKLMGSKMEGGASLAKDAQVYAANNYGYTGTDMGSGNKNAPSDKPAVAQTPAAAVPDSAQGAQAALRKADAKATPATKVAKADKKKKDAVQGDKTVIAANKAAEDKKKADEERAASASALALAVSQQQPVTPTEATVAQATPVEQPVAAVPAASPMPEVPTSLGRAKTEQLRTDEQTIATQIVQQQIVKSSNQEAQTQTAAVQPVAQPQAEVTPEAAVQTVAPAQVEAAVSPQVVAAPMPVTPDVQASAVPERPVSDSLPPEMRTVVVDNQPDLSKLPPPQVVVQKEERSGGVGPMPTLNDIPTTIGEMGLSLVNLAQT